MKCSPNVKETTYTAKISPVVLLGSRVDDGLVRFPTRFGAREVGGVQKTSLLLGDHGETALLIR